MTTICLNTSLRNATYVVVDLETTGSSPANAEILEIGAVKVEGGHVVDRFHSLIKPEGRIPSAIVKITGIYAAMVADKPRLEKVLPDFLDFLGDAPLAAHNSSFDRAFLDAVVMDFRGTPLENPDICTYRMARKLLPNMRSRGLDALAQHYQLENPARHRAHGDAEVTAQILLMFLELAIPHLPDETLGSLLAFQAPKSRKSVGVEAYPLSPAVARSLPNLPGVYWMTGANGEVLYIGKAKNLRNRVRSYFQSPQRQPRKTVELMRQTHAIEHRVLGSELEALLVEARLIKEQKPYFNRMIKNYKSFPFIKVSIGHPYPRVSIAQDMEGGEPALYFGPFRKRHLETALEELGKVFKVRVCGDAMFQKYRLAPCPYYHIGQCSGPCAGMISPEAYREDVENLLNFLEGKASQMVERLTQRRDEHAAALRFEQASQTQEVLMRLLRLQVQSSLLVQAVHRHNCLTVMPDTDPERHRLFFIRQGYPVHAQTFDSTLDTWESVVNLVRAHCPQESEEETERSLASLAVPSEHLEETRIVAHWLAHREPHEGIVLDLNNLQWEKFLPKLQLALFEKSGTGDRATFGSWESMEDDWFASAEPSTAVIGGGLPPFNARRSAR